MNFWAVCLLILAGLPISCSCCWCCWCFWHGGKLRGLALKNVLPIMMIFTFTDEFGFGRREIHQARQNCLRWIFDDEVMDSHAHEVHSSSTLNINLAVPDQIQPQSTTNHNSNNDPAPPYPESPPVREQPPTYQDAIYRRARNNWRVISQKPKKMLKSRPVFNFD